MACGEGAGKESAGREVAGGEGTGGEGAGREGLVKADAGGVENGHDWITIATVNLDKIRTAQANDSNLKLLSNVLSLTPHFHIHTQD